MNKLKLGVIFGGMSTENEVSVASATSILNNLDKEKYEIYPIYIGKDGIWYEYEEMGEKREFGQSVKQDKKIHPNVFLTKTQTSPGFAQEGIGRRLSYIFFKAASPPITEPGTMAGHCRLSRLRPPCKGLPRRRARKRCRSARWCYRNRLTADK